MAEYGQVQVEATSIVDQMLGQRRAQAPAMPSIYGEDRRHPLPQPNAGIPNPAAMAQAPAEPKQRMWWEDDEPAPAAAVPPAAQPPAASQQPATPAPQPATPAQFEVQDFSLFSDTFKQADIATVINGLVTDGRINPMRTVNQADLAALTAGDMSKLPSILNAAVAAGITEAVTATTTLISNSMGKALAPVFDKFSQHTEGAAAKTAVASEYSTPAERALAGMYRQKYIEKNPRATAAQTKEAVKQAMDALGSELVTARQPQQKAAQPVDWASELN